MIKALFSFAFFSSSFLQNCVSGQLASYVCVKANEVMNCFHFCNEEFSFWYLLKQAFNLL